MDGNEINVYIDFPIAQVERTERFFQIARQLSDYIKCLPLDQPTNDHLVQMMIEQVVEAERGAFIQGFKMGMDFALWDSHETGEKN